MICPRCSYADAYTIAEALGTDTGGLTERAELERMYGVPANQIGYCSNCACEWPMVERPD